MTEALPVSMRAMRLREEGGALEAVEVPRPDAGEGQVLLRVQACGVCRTDLHIVDGELSAAKPRVIPGHEIIGRVVRAGPGVAGLEQGARVGVPWLGWSCGECEWCRSGRENLCDRARFTGYEADGGYAEFAVADARYCFPIPDLYSDVEAAPLLCAGLIGYRALRMAGDGGRVGLYGFGAAAHILTQIAVWQKRSVYAFTRPGDETGQAFARQLGALWAGGSDQAPPEPLDAAIIFAPVGSLVPEALSRTVKGGRVVCAGIHMSPIPEFDYDLLWGERCIVSVANLTRRDGVEFFQVAPRVPVRTTVTPYPLAEAGKALDDLRAGRVTGAAVLDVGSG